MPLFEIVHIIGIIRRGTIQSFFSVTLIVMLVKLLFLWVEKFDLIYPYQLPERCKKY